MGRPFLEVAQEEINETPTDFSEFLEFTTRSNIPLNEEHLLLLKTDLLNRIGYLSHRNMTQATKSDHRKTQTLRVHRKLRPCYLSFCDFMA